MTPFRDLQRVLSCEGHDQLMLGKVDDRYSRNLLDDLGVFEFRCLVAGQTSSH